MSYENYERAINYFDPLPKIQDMESRQFLLIPKLNLLVCMLSIIIGSAIKIVAALFIASISITNLKPLIIKAKSHILPNLEI